MYSGNLYLDFAIICFHQFITRLIQSVIGSGRNEPVTLRIYLMYRYRGSLRIRFQVTGSVVEGRINTTT